MRRARPVSSAKERRRREFSFCCLAHGVACAKRVRLVAQRRHDDLLGGGRRNSRLLATQAFEVAREHAILVDMATLSRRSTDAGHAERRRGCTIGYIETGSENRARYVIGRRRARHVIGVYKNSAVVGNGAGQIGERSGERVDCGVECGDLGFDRSGGSLKLAGPARALV